MSKIASERINPEDYDNATEVEFDQAGVYQHFKEQQTDIYQIIMEVIQNAIDSKRDLLLPNIIEIERGKHPVANPDTEPVLTVTDHGDGIAMRHGDDIYKFINAAKAKSEKLMSKDHSLGSKGIGMCQFPTIASRILITSRYKGIIIRVLMFENERGRLAFAEPDIVLQPTKEDIEYYGMYHNGTRISFYHRSNELSWIQKKGVAKLITTIREEYAMRMAENPDLKILFDGKRIPIADWIKDHPPEVLYTNKKGQEVKGNLWFDERGAGNIRLYKGHKIEIRPISPRQCQGYAENWDLKVSAPRTSFIENEEWIDFLQNMRKKMERFPSIGQEMDDPKQFKRDKELARIIFDLPKVPTSIGAENDNTKDQQTGDPKGTDETGYPESKDPDPNRKIKRRKKHKRDNSNQSTVGTTGTTPIKKTSKIENDRRKDYEDLRQNKGHHGRNRPLFLLFQDRIPWLLTQNIDNEEYPVCRKMFKTDNKLYTHFWAIWGGEADAVPAVNKDGQLGDETWRMIASKKRVEKWKRLGYYPKVAIPGFTQVVTVDGYEQQEETEE